MVEPCDNCSCDLADDVDTQETEVALELPFGKRVREYVINKAGLDTSTLVKGVKVCPEKVVVQYEEL